jgi:hypothetical protein
LGTYANNTNGQTSTTMKDGKLQSMRPSTNDQRHSLILSQKRGSPSTRPSNGTAPRSPVIKPALNTSSNLTYPPTCPFTRYWTDSRAHRTADVVQGQRDCSNPDNSLSVYLAYVRPTAHHREYPQVPFRPTHTSASSRAIHVRIGYGRRLTNTTFSLMTCFPATKPIPQDSKRHPPALIRQCNITPADRRPD